MNLPVLLLFFFLYIESSAPLYGQVPETRPLHIYSNPRTQNVEFYFRVDVTKKDAEADAVKRPPLRIGRTLPPILYVWISHPRTWDDQWASEAQWLRSAPQFAYIDAENGNLLHVWQKEKLAPGDSLLIRKRFRVTSFEVTHSIESDKIGNYNKSSYLFRCYTKAEDGIEKTIEIRKLAQLISGDEKNPYLQARLLFGWIILNLVFSDESQIYSAAKTLETRSGDSAHYSLLFVALCRALDIPARLVCGHWTYGNRGSHIWAEFYLPNYGWVPADPAEADYENPEIISNELYKKYFGHLDNKSIIISRGSNIRLWPQLTGKWLSQFNLSADGRSQMMQIADYVVTGLETSTRYSYSWSFWD